MSTIELLSLASEVAIAAGREILAVYNKTGGIDVTVKADESPLTEADRRANAVIEEALGSRTPDIPVLSEESEQLGYERRRQWTRYWLVDPLDGTKEFIKRNGEFTVNIALVDAGQPELGVVHVPVTGVTYLGERGAGAFRVDGNGARRAIQPSPMVPGQTALRVVASRSHKSAQLEDLLARLLARFPNLELVSMGSSLKICLVAEGRADLYPRLGPTSEWDTAAAHAVLAAAGGALVDTSFNELHYNSKPEILNPDFLAIADLEFNWSAIIGRA